MVQQAIDILGLTPGTPKASDEYPAVDTTDTLQSTIGTTKKYLLADLFTFILHSGGFTTLPSAAAASTAPYNATYDNGSGGINATLTDASGTFGAFFIDGIAGTVTGPTSPTPIAYLIKNQINPIQNGIYYLIQNGNGINQPWILMRVPYFNSPANIINGEVLMVTGGATLASTAWQVAVTGTVVVGTTNIIFNPFMFISSFLPIPITVPFGGTGDDAFVPYAVITGGTTATGALQQVAGLGTLDQVLASNGPGTLPTWKNVPGLVPAALTEVNDTNVTMTLAGTPTTALLQAVSMTLGWTGQLAVPRGGTGDASFTAYSVICGGTTSTGPLQNVVGVGTANQVLVSNGAGALPSWQSVPGLVPAALTETNDTNVTMTLGGTPATALLQAVSMTLGWTGQLAVSRGGTGNSTFTAFSVICAGTTATGPFQNVVGLGSTGNVLTSQGAGALPIWAAPATSGTVTSIATNNGVTGGTITTTGTIGLAAIANNTVLANISGGSLFPSSTTATALIDSAIGSTQGDILYRNSTVWTVLPPGTAGQVLSTGGAAANPSWIAAGGTGTVTSISAGTGITLSPSPITSTGSVSLTTPVSLTNGGTNASLTASNGGIVWSNASQLQILSGTSTASQVLLSGASGTPSWSTATYPATAGTSGNILTSNGTNWSSAALSTVLAVPQVTVKTSGSGTYTTPAGALYLQVEMVGGGGGGMAAQSASGDSVTASTNGGNTTFGTSLLAANGGVGAAAAIIGTGGTASGGDINISGGGGQGSSENIINGSTQLSGGNGGSSYFGGAGYGAPFGLNNGGTAAANSGSGGGGGSTSTTVNYLSGNGGGSGGYCRKLISSPSATYSYAVGTAGSGGINTTHANTAGSGAAGIIIITAYFQ